MPPKYGKLVPVPRKSKSKMADKEQCVGEFSSFLRRTAREMERVLCQLKWRKENLMKKVWIGAIWGNATSKFPSIILLIEYMYTKLMYLCNIFLVSAWFDYVCFTLLLN